VERVNRRRKFVISLRGLTKKKNKDGNPSSLGEGGGANFETFLSRAPFVLLDIDGRIKEKPLRIRYWDKRRKGGPKSERPPTSMESGGTGKGLAEGDVVVSGDEPRR